MAFSRLQTCQHQLDDTLITASYDRLTTRLRISSAQQVWLSRCLWFWPWHRPRFTIGNSRYQLKINACVLWRASLHHQGQAVIAELLPIRRRHAVTRVGYGIVMTALRALFSILTRLF